MRPQEKQVCAARLCQFPFSVSQVGRTLNAVKYSLLQASQKPCAKPTYDSARASQLFIRRESEESPIQPQVGNTSPSANPPTVRPRPSIFKRHDVFTCLLSRAKLKLLKQLS